MSKATLTTFRIFLSAGLVFLFCTFSAAGFAQNTYKEPTRRFTIDLPEGYKMAPQKNEYVYQFKGQGPGIMVTFFPAKNETEMFKMALGLMKKPMPDAVLQGNVAKMELNGNPALWGIYKGTAQIKKSRAQAELFATAGSVMLKDGGLMFYSMYGAKKKPGWEGKLKSAFYSIRNADTPVTGITNIEPVQVK